MRIVIDLQGAQTENRFRGIGRYTLSFAKAIVRNRGAHEVFIALNGLFDDTIEPLRAEFFGLLPQDNIRVWYTFGPVSEIAPANKERREAAELIREAFIASLLPDLVYISSLFEGYADNAVTSIGKFDVTTPTCTSLYDLIPLLNPEQYLKPNPLYERYYRQKLTHLNRANLLLAISRSSLEEGAAAVICPEGKIVNVSSAADENFQILKLATLQIEAIKEKFGLTRSFVLCTGGADERKNLPRLIRAYSKLPMKTRKAHHLVCAGKMPKGNVDQLMKVAKTAGLNKDELVFTGYITDDVLIKLYNLCKLYVFPSWHEGFGLPALEAMLCGAAVIGANRTSLPEVINNEEAMFDPFSEKDIACKIEKVLSDEAFRKNLIAKGLIQAKNFNWDKSARSAITAFETIASQNVKNRSAKVLDKRLKLAFVSPLPPKQTGIAYYSADLLSALSDYYDIDVIVDQEKVADKWINENCQIHSPEWLLKNADQYDRVLYHFGNSHFHQYMYPLLKKISGTVCLHDFYMSGYSRYMELAGQYPYHWTKDLYYSHGYHAVKDRFQLADNDNVMYQYPCNLKILESANGIIVHSNYSKQLAEEWYGKNVSSDWSVIPLLRQPTFSSISTSFRQKLNIPENSFIVCTYGALDETKLNNRLINAWFASHISQDLNCYLIFVGQKADNNYGQELCNVISNNNACDNVRITGWVSIDDFKQYLATADLAVQLRTSSRGETSAAIMDCMNYSLPIIANANGSMAELPTDAVWLLEDEFADKDLIDALESLWKDSEKRQALSIRAKETIDRYHAPDFCAKKYAESLESFYYAAQTDYKHLITKLVKNNYLLADTNHLTHVASCIAHNKPRKHSLKTLFLDVTATCRTDLRKDIEHVTQALLLQFITEPPKGFRVEPVYITDRGGTWHYRYASNYTLDLLGCPNGWIEDEVIETEPSDILLAAGLASELVVEAKNAGVYDKLKNIGVSINFIVFDLLPVKHPEFFPPRTNKTHTDWLRTVCQVADKVVCISKSVADGLDDWQNNEQITRLRPLGIDWFHLGVDIKPTMLTNEVSAATEQQLAIFNSRPTFLMVGSLEPRKGYLQVIEAFEQLWNKSGDVNLVVVGEEGWKGLPEQDRRTIPRITEKFRQHSELGNRLFWLDVTSDEFLEQVYSLATCFIAASEEEVFGLPLIKAAQYKLPIIARDIPVFREVAGEHAFYFSGKLPSCLTKSISDWLSLYAAAKHPISDDLPRYTWSESAVNLFNKLHNNTLV